MLMLASFFLNLAAPLQTRDGGRQREKKTGPSSTKKMIGNWENLRRSPTTTEIHESTPTKRNLERKGEEERGKWPLPIRTLAQIFLRAIVRKGKD